MATVISGNELALRRKEIIKLKTQELFLKYGRVPHLAVILVGEDQGSLSYVKGKEKACADVGFKATTYRFAKSVKTADLIAVLDRLNADETVDAILVQLPLPAHIDEDLILNYVSYAKDVDGFHSLNVAGLFTGRPCIKPCTPKGIIALIDSIADFKLEGKNVCVVGRSKIVGLPTFKMFLDRNATVTVAHSKTLNLQEITLQADVLVVAVGKQNFLKHDMVKEGAIVIDVGINRDPLTGKICGDVDFVSVEPKVSYITKVPGGVGPMTICSLLENTLELFLKHVEV